jgi:predicted nucleic-acid-binding protein
MKKAYVDANVVLRFITNDPPDMAQQASKLFMDAHEGRLVLVVSLITLAEIVWVLESHYGHTKIRISEILISFISAEGLEVAELDLIIAALDLYQSKNIDFADALLAAQALNKGPATVYSFDRHFDRIPGITALKP